MLDEWIILGLFVAAAVAMGILARRNVKLRDENRILDMLLDHYRDEADARFRDEAGKRVAESMVKQPHE